LFGWSRYKAEERQAELRRTVEGAVQDADQQSALTNDLEKERSTLQAETKSRQADLDVLLAENSRLERDLDEATKRGNRRTSDLLEARKALTANRDMLASFKSNRHPVQNAPNSESIASKLVRQNERLLKLVLLLSKR